MEFAVLGPLLIQDAKGPVILGSAKQRALLAVLVLQKPGHVVTVERLIDELWGEDPPRTGVKALQVQASHLRRALGPEQPILTRPGGYALDVDASAIDVHRFETQFAEARRLRRNGEAEKALSALESALGEWRGPALPDVTLLGPSASERQRLNETRLVAEEERIELQLERGAAAAVAPELERLIAENPYREHLYELLMLALYRAGRQADALQAFRRARAVLMDELGLDPGAELVRLEAAVLAQDPALHLGEREAEANIGRPAIPIQAPEARAGGHVPHISSSILGREAEVESGLALIQEGQARLITLTGTGGIGKTRLALELERRVGERACLVELGALTDPDRVLAAIAAGVGADEASEAGIAAALGNSPRVLFLDNFEQVLSAAPALSSLLRALPAATIVATSRAPLHITGERELPVPPLSPQAAAELFLERANDQATEFSAGPEEREQIAAICRRLDGLPLAIELAAARIRVLTPGEILDRLGRSLDLLTAGRRDAPERHRTLRATIAWSYDLLTPVEQRLFAQLAVFVSGWSLEACEAVAEGPVINELTALVEQGLVTRDQARFRMLETVREYATELLDASADAESVRRRHALWCLNLVKAAQLEGPPQVAWFARLSAERENLGAAATWALEHDEPEIALELSSSVWRFWIAQGGSSEVLAVLTRALAAGRGSRELRAKALIAAGILAGDRGDIGAARGRFEEALELATALDDRRQMARALMNLGVIALNNRDYRRALRRYSEAGEIWQQLGEARGQSIMCQNQAVAHGLLGEFDEALPLLEKSIELARSAGDRLHLAQTLIELAKHLLQHRPDDPRIASLLHDGLQLLDDLVEPRQIVECLEAISALGVQSGSATFAAEIMGSAEAERERLRRPRHGIEERPLIDATIEKLKLTLGQEGYETSRALGAGRDLATAVETALDFADGLASRARSAARAGASRTRTSRP